MKSATNLLQKKNGCWAEFRADPKGLQFGIAIAFFLGFLFMAPGAVMVAGLVTRRQNGHIAVAGPLTNFALFVVGIPLWGLILGVSGAHEHLASSARDVFDRIYLVDGALVWQAMLADAAYFWLSANLVLGLFNMLPFGPLDGLKVKDWNEQAFFAVLLLLQRLWFRCFLECGRRQTFSPSLLNPSRRCSVERIGPTGLIGDRINCS